MKKMLIVYYSWSHGNTKRIAECLAQGTGAKCVSIDTVEPYKGTYDEVVEQGRLEVQKGFMPDIREIGVNISDFDLIAVGTPTWWFTMAPAVRTFLHSQDWQGKDDHPIHDQWRLAGACHQRHGKGLRRSALHSAHAGAV